MNRTDKALRIVLVLAALTLICAAVPSVSRERVAAPPGGGEGLTVLSADNLPPYAEGPFARPEELEIARHALKAGGRLDDIGGDDVDLAPGLGSSHCSLDIAANGDIYAAVTTNDGVGNTLIEVHLSRDGGVSFDLWGTIEDPHVYCLEPDLDVVEGSVSGCYIAYRRGYAIELISSPLGGASAAFGAPATIFADADEYHFNPRLDTDVTSYDTFYVYVVAQSHDTADLSSIWFARSTDQGASFETPYQLAALLYDDRYYSRPDIAYGFGGHLHVVWHFFSLDGSFDASVRYRRASTFANAGIGDWDYWQAMTSTSDGMHDKYAIVHAGRFSDEVMIAYSRFPGETSEVDDVRAFISADTGVTFGSSVYVEEDIVQLGDIAEDHDSGIWHVVGKKHGEFGSWQAHTSDLSDWGEPLYFNDVTRTHIVYRRADIALNPIRGNRPAWVWHMYDMFDEPTSWFDAAWRNDPGWPNVEPGFPLGLWAPPISPPAVVDVDGDPELEIVFTDALRQIQVFNPDGSPVPGWPVDVGVTLSDGPVAVGDLNGDGEPMLVVGGTDGRAYAFHPDGSPVPGWPTEITTFDSDVYVSIGALGGPLPRTVVCAADRVLTFRTHHGEYPPNTYSTALGSSVVAAPAAIGDIDGDGVAEVVCGLESTLYARERNDTTLEMAVTLPAPLSDAVTLGDLDLDGDLEILCPTTSGVLYAYDHTGTPLGGGFPYATGNADSLTSAAIAQFRSSSEPDIAFGHHDWAVHALFHDGSPVSGFPVNTTDYWYVYGAPIIASVNGAPSDVVIGDRGEAVWSWGNAGGLHAGWPMDLQSKVNLSPAHGDIDNDGRNELVLLSEVQLWVVDLNSPPSAGSYTWPMYGHDPRRTGCADCPEDLVTAVEPGVGVTRVSFAGASPNPVSGATSFAFAVPLRAAVDLEIVDLRGRRVFTVFREEMDAGERVVAWHGKDTTGRLVASGQYFARLRVRGAGVDETLTRKLTVVR